MIVMYKSMRLYIGFVPFEHGWLGLLNVIRSYNSLKCLVLLLIASRRTRRL